MARSGVCILAAGAFAAAIQVIPVVLIPCPERVNTMDKLRIALLFCIAMVSFMLVMEYAQFRDNKSKQQLLDQQSLQQTISHRQTSLPVVDDNGEIPLQAATAAAELPTGGSIGRPLSNQLIDVHTDTLHVQIDPVGGDIVAVALKKHLARIDTPNIPLQLLERSLQRTYIAQSGLIGKNGTDSSAGRPHFVSEHNHYQLADNEDELQIDLQFQDKGILITKRFRFRRNQYLIGLEYLINNHSSENWQAGFYGQIKRDGSADPAAENGGGIGMAPYLGFATTTADERFKKIDFDDVVKKPFAADIEDGWIAMIQHYFLSAWIPEAGQTYNYSTTRTKSGDYIARVKSPLVSVSPGEQGVIRASFYAGPKNQYRLAEISPNLDLSVDYGWLWMVAQPLYAILYFLNNGQLHAFGYQLDVFGGFGNWGFAIIFLTILVKLAFFSLNAKAYRSMAKMRAIQPKMLDIRDRYADDRQKQSQEMMALYSKEGVNPLGGCLPILVQMPVFIALYWVLLESVELRHAPFIGYIRDLSAMDPYFVMPVIMGVSMWAQQKLNPPPPDPMQAKIMQFLPIVFTFFFLFFPAGLVLYWVVNNVLSIVQQWIITRRIEAEHK